MKHLESGQVMSVSLQKNLSLLTMEKTTQTEKVLAQAMQKGFRPLRCTTEFSDPACLKLLVEDDQKEFTSGFPITDQKKNLFRLSIVGVAINRMKTLQKDVASLLSDHTTSVLEQDLDPTYLSFLLSVPTQERAEQLLNSVHKAFVK